MPMSFFNQVTGRLSVEGAKVFCNCNPASPWHWFKKEVLNKMREKDGLYIHFTMDDNPSLSEEIKNRYKKMYSGVWKKRFIDGLWVASSGLIYDMFSDTENIIEPEDVPYHDAIKWCVGVDYGTANTTVFSLMFKDSKGIIYVCKEWYFEGRAEAELNNNYDAQKTDLEYSEDAKTFIGENYNLTGLTYKDIIFVVDPAANSFKLQLRRRRFRTKNGNNEVLDGVRTVASYIGQRKLKVSRECALTLQEIHTYSWDVKAQERDGKDVILKQNDHACLHGDTLVLTTDGYIPIKELVGREGYVVTINPDTGERVNKRFFDVRKTGVNADIIRVELENGDYVDLTKDHKVFTVDGWKEAGDLTLNDEIISIDYM